MTLDRDYTSREAAELAGINPATFRSYFKNGHFRVIGSMSRKEAAKDGLAHIYGADDVMCFAVAKELIDRGVHPRAAFDTAAMKFAYSSDGKRDPGGLYDVNEHGYTMLAFDHLSGASKVFSTGEDDSLFAALANLNGGAGHGLFLLVNKIDRDVQMRLREMRGEFD